MKWLILLFPLLQGCGLGILAAGVGASKAGTAKVMDSYNDYVFNVEKINIEREKAGLKPRPVLSKAEWLKGQQKEGAETVAEKDDVYCNEEFEDCDFIRSR